MGCNNALNADTYGHYLPGRCEKPGGSAGDAALTGYDHRQPGGGQPNYP